MRLFELFNDTYDTQVLYDGDDAFRIAFKTDDDEIVIEFQKYQMKDRMKIYDVNFRGGKNLYDLTGNSENPYKVFATIMKEIKQFMNRDNVDGIMFEVDKGGARIRNKAYDSRTKLYNQLLKRFAKDYDIEVIKHNFGDEYIVKK